MPSVILGVDQGTNRTGWAVGDGARPPVLGAWRFDKIDSDDLGGLGLAYTRALTELHDRFSFTHVIYEGPFLDRYRDKVLWLRQRFGIDMILETFCLERGIVCEEAPYGQLKRALSGTPFADKDKMVEAALGVGFVLPKTKADGREDAADGGAAWLIGVRHYAPQHQAAWDRKIYRNAGGLL